MADGITTMDELQRARALLKALDDARPGSDAETHLRLRMGERFTTLAMDQVRAAARAELAAMGVTDAP